MFQEDRCGSGAPEAGLNFLSWHLDHCGSQKNLQISTADTGLWIDQCVEPVKEAETRPAVDRGISEPSKNSMSVHAIFRLLFIIIFPALPPCCRTKLFTTSLSPKPTDSIIIFTTQNTGVAGLLICLDLFVCSCHSVTLVDLISKSM